MKNTHTKKNIDKDKGHNIIVVVVSHTHTHSLFCHQGTQDAAVLRLLSNAMPFLPHSHLYSTSSQ